MTRLALAALLLPLALAPVAAGEADAVPTQIALIRFGATGVPTASPYDTDDGFQWQAVGTLDVPADLQQLFFVRSDYWLGVGYRAIDVCLVSPSGVCMAGEESNPAIGGPCVRIGECPSFATSSDILPREDGTWTLEFRGVTNARTEIRVFAW